MSEPIVISKKNYAKKKYNGAEYPVKLPSKPCIDCGALLPNHISWRLHSELPSETLPKVSVPETGA